MAAVCVVVLVVATSSAWLGVVRGIVSSPQAVARSYLDDLARGDADAAGALSGTPSKQNALLSQRAFAVSTSRISDIRIGDSSTVGDIATIKVSYLLAGSRRSDVLHLTRTGTSGLVMQHWRVTPLVGKTAILVPEGLADGGVSIGGVTIPTLQGELDLRLYPGTYRLDAAEAKYLDASSLSVTIASSTAYPVQETFPVHAKAVLATDADGIVDAFVKACATQAPADYSPTCPFADPDPSVSYSVTRMPPLVVHYDGGVYVSVTSARGAGHVAVTDVASGRVVDETFTVDSTLFLDNGVLVLADG